MFNDRHLRHYQKIEAGQIGGSFEIWDVLEDMLGIHQRKLRVMPPPFLLVLC